MTVGNRSCSLALPARWPRRGPYANYSQCDHRSVGREGGSVASVAAWPFSADPVAAHSCYTLGLRCRHRRSLEHTEYSRCHGESETSVVN